MAKPLSAKEREAIAKRTARKAKPSKLERMFSRTLTEKERDVYLDAYIAAFEAWQSEGAVDLAHVRNLGACTQTAETLCYLDHMPHYLPLFLKTQEIVDARYHRELDGGAIQPETYENLKCMEEAYLAMERQLHSVRLVELETARAILRGVTSLVDPS